MKKEQIALIIKIITDTCPKIVAIYLFGSQSTEFATHKSDIDIALLFPFDVKFSEIEKWQLCQDLAISLNQDVDLMILNTASTVLRYQIISEGKLLYCSDINACDKFEMLACSMYLRFNEERKPILDEIAKRGRIHE